DPGEAAARLAELTAATPAENPLALRDLLALRPAGPPLPLAAVEPVEAIRRRFVATAMSLGALSPEAYTTLAAAMNRMGARSNSGEGGEDPDWYAPRPDGDVRHSRIKQVASARFGVTARYLVHADELEIKMAQGSKPGEGGQLPGHKVTELIARLRHAVPGVTLISPPPHHDIYSIEDLAQLIYDLRAVHPRAKVGVKLVATSGVGTIAAGVAKAGADYVLISGHSGGTGASPLGSIKHAGLPWELGVAEAQQTLARNGLRGRVRLRTDGGLRTARDVVVAALLGAEDYGFGTAALVSLGCDMARQCHLNTCPTGIATQRPELRAKFRGTPEQVVRYFTWLAGEVRALLAALGLPSLDAAAGRVDLLGPAAGLVGGAAALDLAPLLAPPAPGAATRQDPAARGPRLHSPLATALLREAETALYDGRPVTLRHAIQNRDRAIGAELAGALARLAAAGAGPAAPIEARFAGSAGQSFGAFCVPGLTLRLTGEANDYVAKGMSGGTIVIRPTYYNTAADGEGCRLPSTVCRLPVLVGNTALYGATGGELFVAGAAGERFAVRNSGATAVVEGVGDHGCEYMTGGTVLVLGPTGRNFAAGMSAGLAYVYDEGGEFPARCNHELVTCERVAAGSDDAATVRALLIRHRDLTGSPRAAAVLADWAAQTAFWVVRSKAVAPIPAPERPARAAVLARRHGDPAH
ncbi:MAG TPA: glutamate synthase-related protein, partial [Thermomicrobiales bacterium]|nr:glutamate synthase-related protein [Thermomicrobiales bacterium]